MPPTSVGGIEDTTHQVRGGRDLSSDLTIRPYEPRDLEVCRGLWRELTQRHRDIYDDQKIGGDDPGTHFDTYLSRADLGGAWVAERERAVVGLTGLLVDGDEAQVEPVVVTAALRSQGIGRRLIDRMIEEAFHEAGFRTLGHLDMFMHLGDDDRSFKPGITVHGRDFSY
jgi:GNAT superfamily N-acetyltransferase